MIIGGAQENTLLTVRGLMAKGHDVILLSGPTTGPEGRLLDTVSVPGLQFVEFPLLLRPLNPLTDLRAYIRLKRYFRDGNFDVVHTHSSKAGIVGRLAAAAVGCPLVIHTVHGQAFHPYEKWWRNRAYIAAERRAARASHHILAVAQAMVDQCVAAKVAPRDKYSVVYSGMDIEPYLSAEPDSGLRARLGIPDGVPVVGKIARLFELKGHDLLLAAATRVVAEFPEARFLLVGDGILRPKLEAEAARLGLGDNVVFAGLVPPDHIPRYIALMDMLVHLSLREGLPRTVVQALAGGKPAIGYDLDGTPEVILDGQTGRICPPGDRAAVTGAILDLLRNPQNAAEMGRAGRELVREQFDWHTMARRIEEIYERLLGGR